MKERQGTKRKDEHDWKDRLERFFSSPLAKKAGEGLSSGASVGLEVGSDLFLFRREKGKNTLARVKSLEGVPLDVKFWVPLTTLRHLLTIGELPQTGIGTMGVAIFEQMFLKNEKEQIRFQLQTGILSLWSRGYFSVLKAGGPEVASYLARYGFDNLARIKEALKKLRS